MPSDTDAVGTNTATDSSISIMCSKHQLTVSQASAACSEGFAQSSEYQPWHPVISNMHVAFEDSSCGLLFMLITDHLISVVLTCSTICQRVTSVMVLVASLHDDGRCAMTHRSLLHSIAPLISPLVLLSLLPPQSLDLCAYPCAHFRAVRFEPPERQGQHPETGVRRCGDQGRCEHHFGE
jgi:hypothetical protein